VLRQRPRHHDAVDLDGHGGQARSAGITTEPGPRRGVEARRDFHSPRAELGLRQIDDERGVGLRQPEVVEGAAVGLLTEEQVGLAGHCSAVDRHVDRAATRRRRVGRRSGDRHVQARAGLAVAGVRRVGVVVVAGLERVGAALGGVAGVDRARIAVVAPRAHPLTLAELADVLGAGVAVGAVAVLLAGAPFLVVHTLPCLTVPTGAVAPIVGVVLAVVADLLRELANAGLGFALVFRARIAVLAGDRGVDAPLVGVARVRRARVEIVAVLGRATLARTTLALVADRAGIGVVAGHGVDAVRAGAVDAEVVGAGVVVGADLGHAGALAVLAGVIVGAGVAVVARARSRDVDALGAVTADVGRADVVVVAVGIDRALSHHLGDLLRDVRRLLDVGRRRGVRSLLAVVGLGVGAVLRVGRVRRGVRREGVLEVVTAADHQRGQHRDQTRGQLDALLEHDEGPSVGPLVVDTARGG